MIIGDNFSVNAFNLAAAKIFATGTHLQLRDNRLIVVNRTTSQAIEAHFLKPWRRRTSFLLRDAEGQNPLIFDALCDRDVSPFLWLGVVRQPGEALSLLTRLMPLAQAYKLTPAEQRIIVHIVKSDDTDEVASAAGVTVGTVRTHLKSIYLKLGVRSRAALVRAVLVALL